MSSARYISAKQKKAMKWLAVGCIPLMLIGCNMSHEEYAARVEYCIERGLGTKVYSTSSGSVYSVRCATEDGYEFSASKGGK